LCAFLTYLNVLVGAEANPKEESSKSLDDEEESSSDENTSEEESSSSEEDSSEEEKTKKNKKKDNSDHEKPVDASVASVDKKADSGEKTNGEKEASKGCCVMM
jgi:hypothetical protein